MAYIDKPQKASDATRTTDEHTMPFDGVEPRFKGIERRGIEKVITKPLTAQKGAAVAVFKEGNDNASVAVTATSYFAMASGTVWLIYGVLVGGTSGLTGVVFGGTIMIVGMVVNLAARDG